MPRNTGAFFYAGFHLKHTVHDAEITVSNKYELVSAARVMANQYLGFWTRLFDLAHYRWIGGSVIHWFPNRPSSINRRDIAVYVRHFDDIDAEVARLIELQ